MTKKRQAPDIPMEPSRKTFMEYFNIKPKVKQRPRMSRRGHVFTPAATALYESQVAGAYRGSPNATDFEGLPISVRIILDKDGFDLTIEELREWLPSKLRGDLDNYAKAILDALNGVAFDDDRQVRWLYVEKKG